MKDETESRGSRQEKGILLNHDHLPPPEIFLFEADDDADSAKKYREFNEVLCTIPVVPDEDRDYESEVTTEEDDNQFRAGRSNMKLSDRLTDIMAGVASIDKEDTKTPEKEEDSTEESGIEVEVGPTMTAEDSEIEEEPKPVLSSDRTPIDEIPDDLKKSIAMIKETTVTRRSDSSMSPVNRRPLQPSPLPQPSPPQIESVASPLTIELEPIATVEIEGDATLDTGSKSPSVFEEARRQAIIRELHQKKTAQKVFLRTAPLSPAEKRLAQQQSNRFVLPCPTSISFMNPTRNEIEVTKNASGLSQKHRLISSPTAESVPFDEVSTKDELISGAMIKTTTDTTAEIQQIWFEAPVIVEAPSDEIIKVEKSATEDALDDVEIPNRSPCCPGFFGF